MTLCGTTLYSAVTEQGSANAEYFNYVPANYGITLKKEIMLKTVSLPVINIKSTGCNIAKCRR